MREIYESERDIYLVMDHYPDGELEELKETFELEEAEIALIMH